MIWIGGGVLPQATFVASYLQQSAASLRVKHIVEGNKLLKQLKFLPASLYYRNEYVGQRAEVCTFADVSFNIAAGLEYGKMGMLVSSGSHTIDWISQKTPRISHLYYDAEILTCADGDDMGYRVKMSFRELLRDEGIKHVLHVESKGLFDTITTLHNRCEYC